MIVAVTGINSGLAKGLINKLQNDALISKIIGIDISEFNRNKNKIEFHKIDIRDKNGMINALKGVDIVIHLAFIVIPKKLPRRNVIYDINYNGSKNVFLAAAKNKVKKIIYTSSESAYGHVPQCSRWVNEDSPLYGIKTTNFYYSHTKGLVETFLDKFEKKYPHINVIRFRPPIIFGPHYGDNMGFLSIKKKKVWVIAPFNFGGRAPCQYVHQDDISNAIILAIKKDVRGAYNVASNVILDLIEYYKKFGIEARPIPPFILKIGALFGKIIPITGWVQGGMYGVVLKTNKIKRELGWSPTYTTEELLKILMKF